MRVYRRSRMLYNLSNTVEIELFCSIDCSRNDKNPNEIGSRLVQCLHMLAKKEQRLYKNKGSKQPNCICYLCFHLYFC